MNDITVEPLAREEIPAASTVLSHAFLTQPNNIALWRGQDEATRRGAVPRAAKIQSVWPIARKTWRFTAASALS